MRAICPQWFGQTISRVSLALLVAFAVSGATAPAALASLSQAYATTAEIPVGSLVSLDEKTAGNVVVADTLNSERLFGIIVSPTSASISLGNSSTSGQVQVATSGAVSGLVSTAAGDIKVGDLISVSPIAGVGMKAASGTRVIGTAQADFSASSEGVARRTIDTGSGKKEVALGQIPILIQVATKSNDGSSEKSVIPSWAQSISNTLAGKAVDPVRIIIAGMILLVAMTSVSVLLYAAVRNSIISIGRNPLSRSSVFKSLLQVVIIAAAILGATVVAMYLVIAR